VGVTVLPGDTVGALEQRLEEDHGVRGAKVTRPDGKPVQETTLISSIPGHLQLVCNSVSGVCVVEARGDRVTFWKEGAVEGEVVAGGRGPGGSLSQLNFPSFVAVDVDGSLVISDVWTARVVRWKPGSAAGESVAGGFGCGTSRGELNNPEGVAIESDGAILICDSQNHRVMRWRQDDEFGEHVCGVKNHREPDHLTALNTPTAIAIGPCGSIFISDSGNHRVVRWKQGLRQFQVVAGGRGRGSSASQLDYPAGLAFEADGSLLVADCGNARVMRWRPEADIGDIVVGPKGSDVGLLTYPTGIAVAPDGALYVSDQGRDVVFRWKASLFEEAPDIVAGGHGTGQSSANLSAPRGICLC